MKSRLAVAALNNAVARRAAEGTGVAGCVVHSDRGSQFRSRKFVRAIKRHDMVGSMGRVGAAGDNAVGPAKKRSVTYTCARRWCHFEAKRKAPKGKRVFHAAVFDRDGDLVEVLKWVVHVRA